MNGTRRHRRFFPIWFLILVLISQSVAETNVFSGEPSIASPIRWALLIGISQYQNDRLPPLPGSRNDIEVIRQVLTTRFGFSQDHTNVLEDHTATRKGILHALRKIVRDARPNDFLYIHYSGHGSQVKDFNGDEHDDQLDETIVPYDGRTKGIPDITDDEIEQILSRLNTEGALIVLDSCHSGTATRGVEVRTRAIPPDKRLDLYRHLGSPRREVIPLLSERYVLMTGAAANERALDGSVNGRHHGLFSYSLFRTFGSMDPQTSTREVFQQAQTRLRKMNTQLGRRRMPRPQLEAPPHRLDKPIFPQDAALNKLGTQTVQIPLLPWVSVRPIAEDRVLLEIVDDIEGLIGSVWGLYPPGQPATTQRAASAFATAVATYPHGTVGKVEPAGTVIPTGTRAVMIAPGPASHRVPVLLRSVPPDFRATLEKALHQHMNEVQVVEAGEFARYVVDIEGETVHVFTADGLDKVASFPANNVHNQANRLVAILAQSDSVSELFGLESPSSQVTLQARIVKVNEFGQRIEIDDVEEPTFQIRKEGADRNISNSLLLEIWTAQDSFLTIVHVNAEGKVNLMFPNKHQNEGFHQEGFVKGGIPFFLPDSLDSPNRAGFYYDITGPPGVDSIRIFVNTDVNTAQKIRRYVQQLGMSQGTHTQESSNNSPRVRSNLRELRTELIKELTNGIIVAGSSQIWSSTEKWSSSSNIADLPNLSASSRPLGNSESTPMAKTSHDSGSNNSPLNQLPVWAATSVFFKTTR